MEKYTTPEIIPELSSLISSKKIEILNKDDLLDTINYFLERHQSDQPFFIVNLAEVIKKINQWREKNKDEYNLYQRNYRAKRKAEGRPVTRNS